MLQTFAKIYHCSIHLKLILITCNSENNNPITFENYLYSHFYCLSPDNGTLNGFNALEDNLKF